MYNTRHVLNTLLQRAFKEGRTDVSPMKAQKLLFYTHGWHLATTGHPAIEHNFDVWQFGPVVPDLYHDLKHFGSGPVSSYVKNPFEDKPFVVNPMKKALYESLDIAWEKYIGIPAVNLSAMTHEVGSPWDVARRQGLSTIPNALIRDYFVRSASR
ncbi:Panacea domain-containing protein [Rhizobium grahamii]|uniref:Phage-associated protein n=1 Tax=Rhizobium grahamii CCGE 502 TaxID=990285 RepID=S3HIR3_9HYPH|nr:type II toxin-antitoxin system antitoxin SocA domain-containing protein [Rhizobium grahamii]EPE98632.1 phage-associated protein [Rhizobium grahamii CCGE 502]